jgi:hypothetical protein
VSSNASSFNVAQSAEIAACALDMPPVAIHTLATTSSETTRSFRSAPIPGTLV